MLVHLSGKKLNLFIVVIRFRNRISETYISYLTQKYVANLREICVISFVKVETVQIISHKITYATDSGRVDKHLWALYYLCGNLILTAIEM